MNTKKKLKIVNSNKFGLSGRTILGVDNKNNHYIIKNIKSRIMMETGKKINEIANKIRFKIKGNVILATTAPVCSKTKKYLKEKKINIIFDYIIS